MIATYDSTNLKIYLTLLQNIHFESFVRKMDKAYLDSIVSYPPVCIMTISDMSGKTTKIKTYLKPVPEGGLDIYGDPIEYDVDRMYALIDDEKEFVTIQYFVFDKLFLTVDDFLKK